MLRAVRMVRDGDINRSAPPVLPRHFKSPARDRARLVLPNSRRRADRAEVAQSVSSDATSPSTASQAWSVQLLSNPPPVDVQGLAMLARHQRQAFQKDARIPARSGKPPTPRPDTVVKTPPRVPRRPLYSPIVSRPASARSSRIIPVAKLQLHTPVDIGLDHTGAVLDVQSPGFSVDNAGPTRERVPPRTPEVGDAVASGGVQTPAPTPMPQLSSDVDNSAEDDIALKATPLLHRQIEARLQETAHQDLVDATLAANPVPPTPSAPLKTRFDCDHDAFECVVDCVARCCAVLPVTHSGCSGSLCSRWRTSLWQNSLPSRQVPQVPGTSSVYFRTAVHFV